MEGAEKTMRTSCASSPHSPHRLDDETLVSFLRGGSGDLDK